MKVGIIGVGVVGGAMLEVFKKRGLDVVAFDKNKPGYAGTMRELLDAEVMFLCLPTPTSAEGIQDTTALIDVLKTLSELKYQGVCVNKSTILPGATESLADIYQLKMVHNPEFLTQANAKADFEVQPAVLLGGPADHTEVVAKVYLKADFHVVKQYDKASSTEMAKYIHNVFLALKVGIFNEFREYCKVRGVDFADARDGALAMNQIGAGHSRAPGIDGLPGFGGACFVKDTLALHGAQSSAGVGGELNEALIRQNKRLRPQEYKS